MRNSLLILLLVFSLLGCSAPTYSKAPVDEIVITGGRLSRAVEVHDRQMLEGLDPWRGGFIDWKRGPVAPPSDRGPSYEILFYMKWKGRHSSLDRGDLKLIYNVLYRPRSDDGPGYVYLPGKDDKYSVNMGTIIRENDDGKWHQSSASFDSLIKRVLPDQLSPSGAQLPRRAFTSDWF
jgi:hypothetical protein